MAIPHFIVLFFLWIAFLVVSVWWLLALPHYLVVAVFTGGAWAAWTGTGSQWTWSSGGLIGLLVLFAGIVLLFTGRIVCKEAPAMPQHAKLGRTPKPSRRNENAAAIAQPRGRPTTRG